MEARTNRGDPAITKEEPTPPVQPPIPTRPDGIYIVMFWDGAVQSNIGFQFAPDSTYDEMALGISAAVEGMLRKAAELQKNREVGSLLEQLADLRKQLEESKNGNPDRQHHHDAKG